MLIRLLCSVNLNGSKHRVDELLAERDGKGYSVHFITPTKHLLQASTNQGYVPITELVILGFLLSP